LHFLILNGLNFSKSRRKKMNDCPFLFCRLLFFLLFFLSFTHSAQIAFDNFSFGTAVTSPDGRLAARTVGLAAWRGSGTVANLGAPISVLPNVTVSPSSTGVSGVVALMANWSTPAIAAQINAHNLSLFISVYFLVPPNTAAWRVGVGLGNRPTSSSGGVAAAMPTDADAFGYSARLVGTATAIRYQTFSINGTAATTLSNLPWAGPHAVNTRAIMPMFLALRVTPNTRTTANEMALSIALASNTVTPAAKITAAASFLTSGNFTYTRTAQNPLGLLLYGVNVTIAQVRVGTAFADMFAAAPPAPITTAMPMVTLPTLSTTTIETSSTTDIDETTAGTIAPTTKTFVVVADTPGSRADLNNMTIAIVVAPDNATPTDDSTGIIIGVVVGVLALVAAAAVVFVVYKKHQAAQNLSVDTVNFDRPKYGKIPDRPGAGGSMADPSVGQYGPAFTVEQRTVGEYAAPQPGGNGSSGSGNIVSSYGNAASSDSSLYHDALSQRGPPQPHSSATGSDSQYGDLTLGNQPQEYTTHVSNW
jgi:hypothetical protein